MLYVDFIEVQLHYDAILHLMPQDYGLTLDRLRPNITDDEMAPILGIDDHNLANRKILNCLIQKLKNREQMLDFCDQLEKVITSQDLKTITDEIRSGKFVCNTGVYLVLWYLKLHEMHKSVYMGSTTHMSDNNVHMSFISRNLL